jgi:hypothetical protein
LMNDSDLLNIRDELLANLNKFTYLLTFKWGNRFTKKSPYLLVKME